MKLWNAQPSYPAMTVVQTLPQLTVFFAEVKLLILTEDLKSMVWLDGWSSQRSRQRQKNSKGGLLDEWKRQRMVWLDEWKQQRVVWLDEWKPQRVVWLAEQKRQKVVWLRRLSQRSRQNCKNLEGWSG